MNSEFKKLSEDAIVPTYSHPGDAGADLYSTQDITIPAGFQRVVSTGLSIKVPEGHVAMVCSRSGLAAKNALFVLNAPGIIDSGYLGEWKVILFNAADENFHVSKGDKIAQAVFVPFVHIDNFVEVDELEQTSRGTGGFGSTGGIKIVPGK